MYSIVCFLDQGGGEKRRLNSPTVQSAKEKIATGVLMAKWDFGTKWTVKPLVVL